MSVNFDTYKIFYYVAKYKNITLAAKALYLSQPTVSHHIQCLEQELNCQLLIRTKKGVILTPEGANLYEHVSIACEQIFLGEKELLASKSMSSGTIRIGASEMTLQNYLLPYLEKFRTRYPNIKLKILNYTTPSAIDALKAGTIDFAIVISPILTRDDLIVTKLREFHDIFIAGPNFSLLKDKALQLANLLDYPMICMEENTTSRKYLEQLFLDHNLVLAPDIELATTDLVTPMVAHNLGIGFVPIDFAKLALKKGKVFELSIAE